jgi:hypothetical protein
MGLPVIYFGMFGSFWCVSRACLQVLSPRELERPSPAYGRRRLKSDNIASVLGIGLGRTLQIDPSSAPKYRDHGRGCSRALSWSMLERIRPTL